MFICPLCKSEFKEEKELQKHFNENVKCRVIAWMYKCCANLKIKFSKSMCEVSCKDCIQYRKYNPIEKQCDIYGVANIMDGDKVCIDFREEY